MTRPGAVAVAGKNGRLGILLDVDAAGRYEVRFRYRVGSPGQNDESVQLVVERDLISGAGSSSTPTTGS